MNKKTYRFLQCMIVLGLTLYLTEKLVSGQISYYINMRFSFLTLISIILLALLTGVGLSSLFPAEEGEQDSYDTQNGSKKSSKYWTVIFFLPLIITLLGSSKILIMTTFLLVIIIGLLRLLISSNVHEEDTGQHSDYPTIALVILAIPLILGLFVPTRALSSSAINTRGMSLSAPISTDQQSIKTMEIAPDDRNVLDWIKIFNYDQDLSAYIGKPANVIGFVYHDSRLEAGNFMVGRFAITCCVADAFAIGMAVVWPESETLPDDTWVNVKGTIDELTLDGQRVPMIHANAVTTVQAPEQPYLYP